MNEITSGLMTPSLHRQRTGLVATIAACLWPLVAGTASADEFMKPQTLERMKHASVYVKTFMSEREQADRLIGSGSGFFINRTGLLMSNNHVVDPTHMKSPQEKQEFHYRGGKLTWRIIVDSGTPEEKTYDATVLYQNEAADQALLQAIGEDGALLESPHYMRLLPESRLSKGIKVWALGFPGGDQQARRGDSPQVQVESGNILAFPRTPGGRIRKVYTDVIARPGNSGGPMVNQDGFLVGTVTLMEPPAGREDTGGARYSALVPANITEEMVRNAFKLQKIREGTDFTPFMEGLTEQSGLVSIPAYDRLMDNEVLYYADGDRIYGSVGTDSIAWDCELGKLTIPTGGIAYIMVNSEGGNLFLEGGNRLSAPGVSGTFPFLSTGGAKADLSFGDVSVISFRRSDRKLAEMDGRAVVFDSDLCHLVLSEVKGRFSFKGKLGTVEIAAEDIERVSRDSDGGQVAVLSDGRRMTGKFEPPGVDVVIAATGVSLPLDLSKVERASFDVRHVTTGARGGLPLDGILREANRELRAIAQMIESDDPSGAVAKLEPWLESNRFRKLPTIEKDQVRLLEGMAALRSGNGPGAEKALRQAARSEDENINAYATAVGQVLKDRSDFRYNGRPLSERTALAEAGAALAAESVRQTRDMLKDARLLQGESKGEFMRVLSDVKKHEKLLTVASVFHGPEAEDLLVRVWKVAMDAAMREGDLVDREMEEQKKNRGSSKGGQSGEGARLALQRSKDELEARKQAATEAFRTYIIKRWDYGFRIEDPDIEEMRAKGSEPPSDGGP